jgi:hypothetical protein
MKTFIKKNRYIILALIISSMIPISDIDPLAENIFTKIYIFLIGCVLTYMLINLYKNKDIL